MKPPRRARWTNADAPTEGHTMSSFIDKAKEQAAELAEKAKPFAEKAKEQAAELAEKAKPFAEKAKEQAAELAEKARPLAADAVDKTADGVDKITGHRYSEKIDGVSEKVSGALRGKGPADATADSADPAATDPSDAAPASDGPAAPPAAPESESGGAA